MGEEGVLVWVVAAKMARIEGRDGCRRGGTEVSPLFCVGARESGGETAERVRGSSTGAAQETTRSRLTCVDSVTGFVKDAS